MGLSTPRSTARWFFFVVTLLLTTESIIPHIVNAAYITNPPDEPCIQWKLDDNAADSAVTGNMFNAMLIGGHTADVASSINGYSAFHLNGSNQYVTIDVLHVKPYEVANLWTKYWGNPVISNLPTHSIHYGQLVNNPAGGWYYFSSMDQVTDYSGIYRWQSDDLITWTNQTEVLTAGPLGTWDHYLQVASVFQKPDGTWIMLYRGYDGRSRQIGLATSLDGSVFTRKDNGGINDGLFPQFGANYDPTGVILVGTTYYVYVNGSPDHGTTNVYYSTDDFNTFIANPNNPIFTNGYFCGNVWQYGDYYYLLIPHDTDSTGSTALYDHTIALYRSTTPLFDADRDYLGDVVVNDQSYDLAYLDTPSVPMTDIYRDTYAPEFGDTLYMLYDGTMAPVGGSQNLAYTTFAELSARQPIPDIQSEVNGTQPVTFSFWVRFDSLTDGDDVFSIGSSATDSSPAWLGVIKASGADNVLSLYLTNTYQNTSQALQINVPYNVIIVDNHTNKQVYINGNLVGTCLGLNAVNTGANFLYVGNGYGGRPLHGYVWDVRIYPKDLTPAEVTSLYTTGSIQP